MTKNSLNALKNQIFKRLKLFIISITLIFVCANNIFAQNIEEKKEEEKKENKAWDSVKGRSLFGINFAPTLYAGIFNLMVDTIKLSGETMLDTVKLSGETLGTTVNLKNYAFGLGFSYDFAPLNFMSVGLDIGFSIGEIKSGEDRLSFYTIPWSLNVKFFVFKKAPFGFFLSPRIGGTAVSMKSYGPNIAANGFNGFYSQGGFYLSFELGWRIQLFPKRGADWPVQVGIDISLFDIGYYVAPWTSAMTSTQEFASLKQFKKFLNMRLLLLPRLGITLRF